MECSYVSYTVTHLEDISKEALNSFFEIASESITIRNRPSFPIVYTSHGTNVAASFNGNCKTCKKVITTAILKIVVYLIQARVTRTRKISEGCIMTLHQT